MSAGDGEREGFLARWSRRKRGTEPPEATPPMPAEPTPPAPAPEAAAAEPLPDLSLLPKIEDLTADSDLRPFLAKGVPAVLQQAALRRMWSVDPVIRDFIGPADYAWDFNAPDGVPGFSLELPEEARALARRLLGIDRDEQDEAEPARAEAPPRADDRPVAAAQETPHWHAAAAAAPDFVPPTLLPDAADTMDAPAEEAPAPRRRHGSALPA
jgi:hypothetical protein